MTQFTGEATVLAGIGGLLGVVCGIGLIGITKVLVRLSSPDGFMPTFDPAFCPATIAVAFGLSLAIGLLAGGYPSWRAARLRSIAALRFE
jgi:putative ABC transport system permease protein